MILALALLILAVVPAPGAAAAPDTSAATRVDPTPLSVSIDSLSPAVIPLHGPITVSGVVRNTGKQTWHHVSAVPLTSPSPMTSPDQVQEAAESEPDTDLGGARLDAHGQGLGDIGPGQAVQYQLQIPRRDLQITGTPGVYWLSVQAVGGTSAGSASVPDGEARTFMPLVGGSGQARVSLVVPIRQALPRRPDGTLTNAAQLARSLAPGGRLHSLLDFGNEALTVPLTWEVDPAVLDAADEIAAGNPGLDLRSVSRVTPSSSSPTTSGAGAAAYAPTDQDRKNATQWLRGMTAMLRTSTTFALPYGDPDVSGLARHAPAVLSKEAAFSHTRMLERKITSSPGVAPDNGYLDPHATKTLDPDVTALLGDHGVPSGPPVQSVGNRHYVYADSDTSSGGPGPGGAFTSVNVRQRILSDAALATIDHDRRPMIVTLPPSWNPTSVRSFVGGLTQPWLQFVPLPTPVNEPDRSTTFPDTARHQEIGPGVAHAARALVRSQGLLDQLLTPYQTQERVLLSAAGSTASYAAHLHPHRYRRRARATNTRIRRLLQAVKVVGTQFVTLSGGSGTLTVSLVNGLSQAIHVKLIPQTHDGKVSISKVPGTTLGAGQRTTIRLHASAGQVGLHQVTLTAATKHGRPVGTPLVFSMRTSQLGRFFWAVLVVGGVILAFMILRRIFRRVRTHRWRQ